MDKATIPPSVPALVKPTLDTPFHIDYAWWEKQGIQISAEIRTHLCPEHQEVYAEHFDTEQIDWIDKKTGEVTKVDGLQHVLQVHCSQHPNYINENISLVDAVFRVFLANGNQPLAANELSQFVGRPAEKILQTLSGIRVYKGVRPMKKK
jgi:hypothetical protein